MTAIMPAPTYVFARAAWTPNPRDLARGRAFHPPRGRAVCGLRGGASASWRVRLAVTGPGA